MEKNEERIDEMGVNRKQNLADRFPELAKEWHPTKNEALTPEMVSSLSNRKVWWKCESGHEWMATVANRVRGNGCPYCANKKVLQGTNDLATKNFDLVKEWHPTKNGELTPEMVTPGSAKKVWWKCECGHEWMTTVAHRSNGIGCPYCASKKVSVGFNDLASKHPELVKEWNTEKNGDLTPDKVTPNSGKIVWWKDSFDHEWKARIADRSRGVGCPYCAGRKVIPGFNDLATKYPELAKEWHPTKNEGLTPEMVTTGSAKKVWWKCELGQEWQASIVARVYSYRNKKEEAKNK